MTVSRRPPARHFSKNGLLAVAAAVISGAFPFLVSITAWPEIVTPAYFVTQGSVLYRDVFFPHTPLLILLTAAGGAVFGFSATLFRCIVGLSLAATAALLVLGVRPGRRRSGAGVAFFAGVPVLLLYSVYHEGPALWPDPFMAPLLLGAGLLLERFERRGGHRSLVGAGLLLGLALLVKQTSVWVPLAATAWAAVASRRRGPRSVALFVTSFCLPYFLFVILWGAAFGTLSHLRWTLLVPIQMGLAGDNRTPFTGESVHEALAPFLGLVALALARRSIRAPRRLRSAAPWLALGCAGMGYPRADLLHLSASIGLNVLLLSRALLVLGVFARRAWRRSPRPLRGLAFAGGVATALISICVAVFGAGPLALAHVGGPAYYWDDRVTCESESIVRRHVRESDRLLLYDFPWDTLYAKTRTGPPGGLYVNTHLWDCINKERAGERFVEALDGAPGTPVLFREPADEAVRRTVIHRFLVARTRVVTTVDERTTWRVVTARAEPPVP